MAEPALWKTTRMEEKDADIEADISAKWKGDNLFDIDVSLLDGRLTVGLLLFVIGMCKFDDGLFLECCESGCLLRCLKRLKEIDEIGGGEKKYAGY